MKCNQCGKNLQDTQSWMCEEEGHEIYLCEDCFSQLEGSEEEIVFCASCLRPLLPGEEYMEETETGEAFCLSCAEKLMQ
ncbi:hypothetical protein [Catellicoccus marimammalium]|uniref:LIM zinc-binding domain-containing protein n=1 Tax=Catellicoccus marimammalium M35/04/3 TaxID=1234409 RepID=K8ZLI5_9ENTE|nr:hypothetical protein [Catellicoccus marimammalium]EKU27423.1 hypothetical protein C683_0754 [Catellicoccus marimammalium M35/04/3]